MRIIMQIDNNYIKTLLLLVFKLKQEFDLIAPKKDYTDICFSVDTKYPEISARLDNGGYFVEHDLVKCDKKLWDLILKVNRILKKTEKYKYTTLSELVKRCSKFKKKYGFIR
jgi:hypothetical protein